MTSAFGTSRPRLYARLPSGADLVPGVSPECAGPDIYGRCPRVAPGAALPCAGATWHYHGTDQTRSWSFVFRSGSSVCPVAVLDPLGPAPLPGD
jgi:hypothetical protein